MNQQSIWQTIAAALSSILVSFLNPLLKVLLASRFGKYALIVKGVLSVIGPLVKEKFPEMTSKDIYQHLRYTIVALYDGELSETEITTIAGYVLEVFDIRIAADSGLVAAKDPAVIRSEVETAVTDFKAKQAALLPVKPAGTAASLLGTVPAGAR